MTFLLAIWKLIGWRGVIVAALIAVGSWWHLSAVSKAYDRGQLSERLVWQEKERRAILKAEKERDIAQAKINTAEAELITAQQQASMRRRAMENALEAERNNDGKPAVDRRACDLPDRVREALKY